MEFVALGVVLLAVPFLLPIALWVALYRTRTRLALLEAALEEQREALEPGLESAGATERQARAAPALLETPQVATVPPPSPQPPPAPPCRGAAGAAGAPAAGGTAIGATPRGRRAR